MYYLTAEKAIKHDMNQGRYRYYETIETNAKNIGFRLMKTIEY
jgi:hypothetical protein